MSRGYDDDVRSLVWFLGGIGVGATVALLFAPQTGKQTRKMLSKAAERGRDYIEDTSDALRDSATDLRDRAGDLRDDVKNRSRDLYERGRDLARDAGEDAATLLDRGKKIVRG
jgi:gas vesicle protein